MELDELARSVTEHGDNVYEEIQASNKYNKYDRSKNTYYLRIFINWAM